ncbi:L-2-amino-thiazoline-4-carboxylic acid hydrolase [Anaerotruncus colihominis]|nr:L-2-amino-thiazoline-4-carboxylic acid hydrolase [Anaerotruncus colihominis]
MSFSGLLPKIRFERTGTLGTGFPYCDFRFFKRGKDNEFK